MIRATVVHVLPGRVRLRLPDRKGDEAFFTKMRASLEDWPPLREMRVNLRTGSVLLRHEGDLADLSDFVESREIFQLKPKEEEVGAALRALDRRMVDLDRVVRTTSRGVLDLKSAAAGGLMLAAGFQVLRGRVFGPATSLFGLALGVLSLSRARLGIEDEAQASDELEPVD